VAVQDLDHVGTQTRPGSVRAPDQTPDAWARPDPGCANCSVPAATKGCPHDAVTSRADLGLAWRSAIKDGKTHVLPAADEQVAHTLASVIPGSE
jgi:hypothetical protein